MLTRLLGISWLRHHEEEAQRTPEATTLTQSDRAGRKEKARASQTADAEATGDRSLFQSYLVQLLKMKVSQIPEVSPLLVSKMNRKKMDLRKADI